MDMTALLADIAVPDAVKQAIGSLLARKLDAAERDTVPRQPVLERFLAESLAVPTPRPAAWEQEADRVRADALFARLVGR